jgi:hypothetical protein
MHMGIILNLLRPEDLVALSIELYNLRLDASNPKSPELVVAKPARRAFLVVYFQPQHVAEKAYFEVAQHVTSNPPFDKDPNPTPTPLPTAAPSVDFPGTVPARMADSSRLVFRLPVSRMRIPFTMEALLDWSDLELVVSPAAAVPDDKKPHPGITIAPPQPLETALELPYRLIVSPNGAVGWVNATGPVTHAGRTELWHTRMARLVPVPHQPQNKTPQEASPQHLVPLRAIWSPDFVDHGPLPSHTLDTVPFLSSMSPRDRDQIVILTSGFDGYYMLDPKTGAQEPFVPTPIHASRLFLSALGAWLKSRGDWSPLPYYYEFMPIPPILHQTKGGQGIPPIPHPRKGLLRAPGHIPIRFPNIPIHIPGQGPPQALDLSEWVHEATTGRDQYVKIVYEGFLYPFGHRASLVKVTERKFMGGDQAPGGSPVAYLRQHMYIVIREESKTYPAGSFTYAGREMPLLNLVEIKTKVTPDIDYPSWIPGTTASASFWVKVAGTEFPFHLSATDLSGSKFDFHAKLIFVSDSEDMISTVQSNYKQDADIRRCAMPGHKIAYADPTAGDTMLKTVSLYFDTQLQPPNTPNPLPPFSSAPFIPMLDLGGGATVSIPALEELLGTTQPLLIQLYQGYLSQGLDSNAGVYADVVDPPPTVKFAANQAGGFGTPNLGLTAISARKGVVGGDPDDAAAGLIDPAAFFDDADAMLFGTIAIKDLIPVDQITKKADASQNAPEIRSHILPDRRHPQQVMTRINWEPQLQDFNEGPVTIGFNVDGDQSALTLNATLVRNLDGTPPTSNIVGKLTSFRIVLFGVIGVKIHSITFTSQNGSKTNVAAQIAANKPIVFEGPLSFIQTLADILPPGLFGGTGPAIDLTPTAVEVSYTLGLPPISIGVFSLDNISIMTGLDLPYLDGKPGFEFAFAKRNAPFILTVECLGGGGFVHLVLDADGIQMVEGALEFGGEFSIDLGVASGAVHIMAGIYFQLKGSASTLTGFVDIGGEVSVLGIISISIDLNLSLSWIHTPQGDKIQGRATLTISVSVLFFSISVQVSVERSFGSGSGDPKMGQLIGSHDWTIYAHAFA